ncbi:MAG TPA: pyridoxal phosphate-dependent aminotransferase [Patescibacteria group bacterium]|nr:pyridoxal phosphate-dependent aminotransferase [Patescibacteria group bacterium]
MRGKTTDEIKPFIVMDVLERALALERTGRSIVHLEIGEPDFATPPAIVDACIEALKNGETHYTDSRGIPGLRAAIASYYERRYGVKITEDRVLVTMGVSPALLLVLSILIEENGDEILLGNPYYPCYPNFIRYMHGTPRFIFSEAADGFQLKPAAVEGAITPKTHAIMINSPSNPTGTLMPRDDLEAICNLGVAVISDEIYHGLVYNETEHTALEFTENAFVLNGFSKLFAMTGWRLGYIIAPKRAVRRLHILLQNIFISPNAFVQHAGIAALTKKHPEIEEMRQKYDARRRYLLRELPKLGLRYALEPRGAFYFFVDTSHIDNDSLRLAFDILEKADVALTPGIDFGDRGEGHLRISYANSLVNITEGVRRLGVYLTERGAL